MHAIPFNRARKGARHLHCNTYSVRASSISSILAELLLIEIYCLGGSCSVESARFPFPGAVSHQSPSERGGCSAFHSRMPQNVACLVLIQLNYCEHLGLLFWTPCKRARLSRQQGRKNLNLNEMGLVWGISPPYGSARDRSGHCQPRFC
ncbi:hypothetical protein GGI43DRAFT_17662 [Trichoderma evansii]